MSSERRLARVEPFLPLRPVTRRQLIVRILISPGMWIAALSVVAVVLNETFAIELGIIVAVLAVAVSLLVLSVLHSFRNQERRRDADGR